MGSRGRLGLLRTLLRVSAAEAATGLAALLLPGVVGWLVFGAVSDDAGQAMGRFAGAALLALGIGCWPAEPTRGPVRGLLAYNVLAAAVLFVIGTATHNVGLLLWPAIVVHSAMAVLLAVAMLSAANRCRRA